VFLGKVYQKKEKEFRLDAMEGAPETDATITIKLLSPGERRKIVQTGFKTTFMPDESGGLNPELTAQDQKAREALFNRAVVGWSGFYEDADGKKPLKFGMAGKKALLDVVPEIIDYVSVCHEAMVIEHEESRKESEKN